MRLRATTAPPSQLSIPSSQLSSVDRGILIEVAPLDFSKDAASRAVFSEAVHLGARGLERCQASRLYELSAGLDTAAVERIARDLLCDPITESYSVESREWRVEKGSVVDVWYKPGVTDPAAATVERAIATLGFPGVRAAIGTRVRFYGPVDPDILERLIPKFLANPIIQRWEIIPR